MPGELDRKRRHVAQLQRDMPLETGVDEAGRRMCEDAQTASLELLPSKRAATVASSLTYSHVEPSAELARMQDPRLVRSDVELLGQRPLVLGRIHVCVGMIVEQAEETIPGTSIDADCPFPESMGQEM